MATHKVYYLTCDSCGSRYSEYGGTTSLEEESYCVRDLATDDHWLCNVGGDDGDDGKDFCSEKCMVTEGKD